MSSPNAPPLPPSPPLSNHNQSPHPPYHAPASLARELGIMLTFAALFPLTLIVYYYAWLYYSELEAKAEWLRRERLAAQGIGTVPEMPRKRAAGGAGLLGTGGLPGRVLGIGKGGRGGEGGEGGWRERWRWSGMEREGKQGIWGGGMVMSTGAGHGGGEMP